MMLRHSPEDDASGAARTGKTANKTAVAGKAGNKTAISPRSGAELHPGAHRAYSPPGPLDEACAERQALQALGFRPLGRASATAHGGELPYRVGQPLRGRAPQRVHRSR